MSPSGKTDLHSDRSVKPIVTSSSFLLVALLVYSATDGWRDAWLLKNWWPRHIVKWLAWYPLPVYLLWREGQLRFGNWKKLLFISATSFITWQVFYQTMQRF